MKLRVIIDDTIHISRSAFEYNNTLYRSYLLNDIELAQDLSDGFLETNWGELEVSIVAFSNYPVIKNKQIVDVAIYIDDDLIFNGIGERALGVNSFVYTLYTSLPFSDNLLVETVDVNDKDITIPEAFGTVDHYKPVLKDDTNFTYFLPPHLTINTLTDSDGNPITGVADDGVWNVQYTIDADGNLVLDNAPVGQISLNVTSLYTTVAEIIGYLSDSIIDTSDLYNDNINFIVSDQISKIDLIKDILTYTSNMAYMNNNTLTVYKQDSFINTIKVDNFNIKPLANSLTTTIRSSYKSIKGNYTETRGVLESNIQQLKDYDEEIIITGNNSYASEITFNILATNSLDTSNIKASIELLMNRYKDLLDFTDISIEVLGIINIQTPTKVLIETKDKTGDMIITGVSHKIGKILTTTIRGFGNVYFKEV